MKWCVVSVCEKPIAFSPRAPAAARCASCPPASPADDDLSPPFMGQSGCCLLSDIIGQSGCAAAPWVASSAPLACAPPAPDCFCARMETATAAATIIARTQSRSFVFLIVLLTFLSSSLLFRPFFLPPAPCGGGVVFVARSRGGGQRFEKTRALARLRLREARVPVGERRAQLFAHSDQLAQTLFNAGELARRKLAHLAAGRDAALARAKYLRQLVEREADAERAPHQSNARERLRGVFAVAVRRAARAREHALALVVAQGVRAHARRARQRARAQELSFRRGRHQ